MKKSNLKIINYELSQYLFSTPYSSEGVSPFQRDVIIFLVFLIIVPVASIIHIYAENNGTMNNINLLNFIIFVLISTGIYFVVLYLIKFFFFNPKTQNVETQLQDVEVTVVDETRRSINQILDEYVELIEKARSYRKQNQFWISMIFSAIILPFILGNIYLAQSISPILMISLFVLLVVEIFVIYYIMRYYERREYDKLNKLIEEARKD